MTLQPRDGGQPASPIKLRSIDQATPQQSLRSRLPMCTSDRQPHAQHTFSNNMMKAYVDMRGPDLMSKRPHHEDDNGDGGPLFAWFRDQEDITTEPEQKTMEEVKRDVKSMLQDIDRAHVSPRSSISSTPTSLEEDQQPPYPQLRRARKHRQAVFQMTRPQTVPHIRPPSDMSLALHHLTASCADFEFSSTENGDDECDYPVGRISPCTFAAWAKGCSRWEGKVVNEAASLMSDARCDGDAPVGGAGQAPAPGRQHHQQQDGAERDRNHCRRANVVFMTPSRERPARPDWYYNMVNQRDEETGEQISPHYRVPSNPSILSEPCSTGCSEKEELVIGSEEIRSARPMSNTQQNGRIQPDHGYGEEVGDTTYLEETQSGLSIDLPIQRPVTDGAPDTSHFHTAQILSNQCAEIARLRREEASLMKFTTIQQSRKLQLTRDLAQIKQHIETRRKIQCRQQQEEYRCNRKGPHNNNNVPDQHPRTPAGIAQNGIFGSTVRDICIQQETHFAHNLHAFILDTWSRIEGRRRENHADEMAIVALEAEMERLLAEFR